jgi:hypothetical protein
MNHGGPWSKYSPLDRRICSKNRRLTIICEDTKASHPPHPDRLSRSFSKLPVRAVIANFAPQNHRNFAITTLTKSISTCSIRGGKEPPRLPHSSHPPGPPSILLIPPS